MMYSDVLSCMIKGEREKKYVCRETEDFTVKLCVFVEGQVESILVFTGNVRAYKRHTR